MMNYRRILNNQSIMSFGFRKSFSTGPFRATFSKSGVSTSFGVKGARVTSGPRGTFITVGSHGFYYRERIGPGPRPLRRPSDQGTFTNDDSIRSAPASDLVDSSSEQVLAELNRRAEMFNPATFAWLLCVAFLVTAMATSFPVFFIVAAAVSVIVGSAFQLRHAKEKRTRLFYELDGTSETRFKAITEAVDSLRTCQKLWRMDRRQYTADWKRNAGAAHLNDRKRIEVGNSPPPNVESNLTIPTINLSDSQLYFLPDRILILQGKTFGAVNYDDLKAEWQTATFIESEGVPTDTQVVGYRWRYMNKDGGPDRRFNNNHQIPVVHYGELLLQSGSGLNVVLQTSQPAAAATFCSQFELLKRGSSSRQSDTRSSSDSRRRAKSEHRSTTGSENPPIAQALKLFGLDPHSSKDELTASYRRLAAMYHPDKVAHLAPEFRELAEERMKEINAAYALLQRHCPA